jgi:hypothetical protein
LVTGMEDIVAAITMTDPVGTGEAKVGAGDLL